MWATESQAGGSRGWSRADCFRLAAWAASIVVISVAWSEWALSPGVKDQTFGLVSLALLLGLPLVLGAGAAGHIHRRGPWIDILILAGVGAGCLFLSLDVQWSSDPRACAPGPESACDVSMGMGAAIVAAIWAVPLLAGAAVGRAVAGSGTPGAIPKVSMPDVVAQASWAPILGKGCRYAWREFVPAPRAMKLMMSVAFVWAASVYLGLGAYIFDAAYWVADHVAAIRARRSLHVGLSVAVWLAYGVVLTLWALTPPAAR